MKNDIKSQFIVSSEEYTGNIDALASRAIKFGKITNKGGIIINNDDLKKEDIVKLSLVLRFIAHAFEDSISESLRPSELCSVSNQSIEAIGSRLSVLVKKEGFAKKVGYGQYAVRGYKIESFLSDLEDETSYNNSPTNGKRKKRRKCGNSTKTLTGVGRDIQFLIDNSFFDEPKLISEILQELKREGFFHDPKVVDRTIAITFLKNRKSLKRIKNEDGGKSKWKYVLRKQDSY